MSQLLVSERVLIFKAIFQENRNVNTEKKKTEYWVPTFPYNSSHIVVAMEQRVQMIPNIAAIYRRNKIVEEKFI